MSQLAGRVVLITGGNAGIGRAAAIAFAKEGAKVVVSGRRENAGREVVDGIKASGGEAIFVPRKRSSNARWRPTENSIVRSTTPGSSRR